jgi:hypothetical protein
MSEAPEEELRHRLAAIAHGPWAVDQALTVPQLYDLAVQSGYLPEELVRESPSSAAARDYASARRDRSRPMREGAALRFAAFLAHLRAFHADEEIQAWTAFMDGAVEERNEDQKLRSYLRGKRAPPARADRLLEGCQRFVASLASAFDVLEDDELGAFGLVHAQRLQTFFDSWARTVLASPRLAPPQVPAAIAELLRRQFEAQVRLLEKALDAASRL